MIDELPTRAALGVAAFILLAMGLSVVRLSDGDAVREAAQSLAAHLAAQLDAVGGIRGEAVFRAGVGADGAFELPPSLAGARYRVEVRAASVSVEASGHEVAAPLAIAVLPFSPNEERYAGAEIAAKSTAVVA
mgnify:FL=1